MDSPDKDDISHGAEAAPAPAQKEPGAGQSLRETRLERGLNIEDVARQLRLSVRQVTALEADDYDKLAGGTFVRGFVRNYAKLLQIDAAPLLRQLEQSLPPPTAQTISNPIEGIPFPSNQKSGRRNLIIVVGAVVALLLLIYEIYRDNEASIERQPTVQPEAGIEAEQAAVSPPPRRTAEPSRRRAAACRPRRPSASRVRPCRSVRRERDSPVRLFRGRRKTP